MKSWPLPATQQNDLSPMAMNNKWGLPQIHLWYTGKHYDLLMLKEGQNIPPALASLSAEATQKIPRGGGPADWDERTIASSCPTTLREIWQRQRDTQRREASGATATPTPPRQVLPQSPPPASDGELCAEHEEPPESGTQSPTQVTQPAQPSLDTPVPPLHRPQLFQELVDPQRGASTSLASR